MRKLTLLMIVFLSCYSVFAEDLRKVYQDALKEKNSVEHELKQKIENLRTDRVAFEKELKAMEKRYAQIESEIDSARKLNESLREGVAEADKLSAELSGDMRSIENAVNTAVDDFRAVGAASGIEAEEPSDDVLYDLNVLADKYMQFYKTAGAVSRGTSQVLTPDGTQKDMNVYSIGSFGYLYAEEDAGGYLQRSESGSLEIVPGQTADVVKGAERYLHGESETVGLDITSGAVYMQWANRITPATQIRKGGVLVLPIFIVFALAVILAGERIYRLYIRGIGDCSQADVLAGYLREGNVKDAESTVKNIGTVTPLGRVFNAVMSSAGKPRNVRSDILEQALISESSVLERNLSFLSVAAAVSPMLGLMGTVTGMISTFHAITVYGSSDPRMMAGGISEALTTTMLGLTAAIPIMLAVTIFNRRTENLTDRLQECAVKVFNNMEQGDDA
ncbi:MotA/TolQ/ExbB proton channel [Denitrovibrio acetiphilus DSM 12809]|uniref:MotA/TolQ/ExbB proton channel n=1 Tax=Denitrovibrio acetiphilus (strain DSM 12809 / NBRC 114555 / N2460) TaxID=522772 RepID=D4H698_DENA2|nr:MotA/TolQ/ExbB proton channel family protein [Denitrovibrio acetiphilus]ADD67744.1 MotA/TolQ/ExbB proton channel [Denitrovibrio acetiphilus DSM 12809]